MFMLLFVLGAGVVLFFGWTGTRSPLVCPSMTLLGVPCPICGMTRSFRSMVRGDLAMAFHYHLFGPLLALGMLGRFVWVSWEWWWDRRLHWLDGLVQRRWVLLWALVTLWLLYFVWRLSMGAFVTLAHDVR
ncbi:MAG: DUF2752 domain-containing protein [Myxococcales bacterium]|nr:DUF2752 domain-containing protein [Myxococcales bacterium]